MAPSTSPIWNLDAWTGPIVQTPCSTIYLGQSHALKLRKSVNLGYLDFTSLESRRHFAHEDLRLNTALAPGVYQRVVPIVSRMVQGQASRVALLDAGEAARLEHAETPFDYAVLMRRLPDAGMLDRVLASRPLRDEEVHAITSRLATFHASCASGPEISKHAAPGAVREELLTNVAQAEGLPGIAPPLLTLLHDWFTRQFTQLESLLARRITEQRIREGHGDLHAGNICFDPAAITPNNPTGLVIYDRLEFRLDFRCTDVAAELAGLASSLDAHGHPDLADVLVAQYAMLTHDPELLTLQPLYRAHYALVRAKVHAMRAGQLDCPTTMRDTLAADAATRLAQAVGYTLSPTLILTCGLPGSGKSYASRPLSLALRARVHRADEIRKELAGLKATDRGGPDIYTPEFSKRTYAEVLNRCERDLRAGRHAIADATFRSRELRRPFLDLARSLGLPSIIVHCHADEDETMRRLASRTAAGADASDADIGVYRKLRNVFETPDQSETAVIAVTPGVTQAEVLDRAIGAAAQPQ